jgi:hypothetical protein
LVAEGRKLAVVTAPGLRFLLALVAGWVNRNQQGVIDFLQAENRFLREQLGPRRLRLSDADRRRLAVAAKRIGRKGLFRAGYFAYPAAGVSPIPRFPGA